MTFIPARRPRPTLLAALTALVLALLALTPPGAARAEGSSNGVPPGASWVRVGHFVPGMGTTSIQVTPLDGPGGPTTLAPAAKYGDVSSYDKLAPGRYAATVRESSADQASAPMLSRSFEVGPGDARTVAVVGTADQPRLALLTDDLTPPRKGTARVRLLSASDAAGTVDVRAVGGPVIAEDAVLGQVTPYVTVPAGTWNLELTSDSTSATRQRVPLASGSVYTVAVLDDGVAVLGDESDQSNETVRMSVVTDAAGAMVSPRGGAKTGEGGTALPAVTDAARASQRSSTGPLAVGLLLTVVVTSGLVGAQRRTRSAR